MKWTSTTPEPEPRPYYLLTRGPVRLSVSDSDGNPDLRWQYFTVTLGTHCANSVEDCMKTWPREAIEKARAALDEFEAQLEGESDVMP